MKLFIEGRGCMKNGVVLLIAAVLVAVVLGAMIISAMLVLPRLPVDSVKSWEWTDSSHSAVVGIYLATDSIWVTNYSRKITFLFTVQNLSGFPNATTFYDNSYVVLNSVKLDPGYMIDISEYPFKQLSEKQGWSAEWYFAPKANNSELACMGISKGKQIEYPLLLEVNYAVIDSEGVEQLGLFQTPPDRCATITIVGGDDAP